MKRENLPENDDDERGREKPIISADDITMITSSSRSIGSSRSISSCEENQEMTTSVTDLSIGSATNNRQGNQEISENNGHNVIPISSSYNDLTGGKSSRRKSYADVDGIHHGSQILAPQFKLLSLDTYKEESMRSRSSLASFSSSTKMEKIEEGSQSSFLSSQRKEEEMNSTCRELPTRRLSQVANKRDLMLVPRQTSMINVLCEANMQEKKKNLKERYCPYFTFYLVIWGMPTLLLMWYASAILFPTHIREKYQLVLWTNGVLTTAEDGVTPLICPRVSICSEGILQIILISLARLTAFASYVTMGITFISKMHSANHVLSSTYASTRIPFTKFHDIHRFQGMMYASLATVHTLVHLIRWIIRKEMYDRSISLVGVSGYFSILCMFVIIGSMSSVAKMYLAFEQRLNLHWVFLVQAIFLCFHHPRTMKVILTFVGLWSVDYLYGILCRTHRLEVVEFTCLPEDAGTQLLWRNPKGFNPRSGEYVKIQIPWLNQGSNQWHPFSLYLREATKEGLEETMKMKVRERKRDGRSINNSRSALLLVEFQNEFASSGGKLHDKVQSMMRSTDMLKKTVSIVKTARAHGVNIIHAPLRLLEDTIGDNDNRVSGILNYYHDSSLFLSGSWNAQIIDCLKPQHEDDIVLGKSSLDCFIGSNLNDILSEKGIETLFLAGFLANGSIESTMRSAYEKGLNVITLTDGCVCNSEIEQIATTQGTFPMFSTPITCQQLEDLLIGQCPRNLSHVNSFMSGNSGQFAYLGDEDEIVPLLPNAEKEMTLSDFVEYTLEKEDVDNKTAGQHISIMNEARQDLRDISDTTQIFVAPSGDWTNELYNEVEQNVQRGSCWVKGPYTSPYSVATTFSQLMLMASGIGITPALGVMGQYPGNSRTKVLVWSVRSSQMVKFFAPLIGKDAHLAVIYYTGKEKLTSDELSSIQAHGNIYIKQSRPESLELTMTTIMLHYEEKMSYALNPCKEFKRSLHSVSPERRAAWCILYCGGSTRIRDTLHAFAKKVGTGWDCELFDW